ncbi:MAG: CRISPR-associated helicase Cas3' [Symplocastrum torsivum CPER-KK1]|jgi:CRISPR-associated endonuclease/helicase Cas3|uniref:CRISPR-associated helicase Cas3 n=1 Tax=Symplocastrum torsivum CPER-KK1 TaxID=450513 RepID=A0A951PJ00_9CYAN|nr:CRISPR-associated helicase Cas3' [Symplocastrum torsivum CPER-KK1]
MSKPERKHPYNFGRVFFPEKPKTPIPNKIYFQPLGNHVGNVVRLVRAWNLDDFPGATVSDRQASFKRVLEAAKVHDMAKPQTFSIKVETTPKHDPKGKFKEYIYSFKGHRFEAVTSDTWAQYLARGHHYFSVDDISRDSYNLKKESQEYADILAQEPLAYARELYILEMCDQIEAELACRIIGDDDQAESRAFMDYTTANSELDNQTYLIDPWPFKDNSIPLSFEYWSMQLSQEDKESLQSCIKAEQDYKLGTALDKIVKNWWQFHKGKPEKAEPKPAILKPYESVNNLKHWDCQTIYKALGGDKFIPNPMQEEMFDAIAHNKHPTILLKAPTGSGKTESILFPALAQGYRLFLPLPARSLLEDQKERVERYLKQFSKLQPERELSLVVDTGAQMYRWVYRNGEEIKPRINPRRHLYKGDVILTTLDKFLYRYFAFGDSHKSFVFPLRINQKETLICFDEAHSYDDISFTNFHSLLKSLYEAGRSLVLMTATMPQEHIERFDYLDIIDYIDDTENAEEFFQFQQQVLKQPHVNQREFEWISSLKRDRENPEAFQNEFAQIIIKEWQVKPNRRIIAVVETVKDAAAIYQQLKFQFGINSENDERFLFLYHGRIADQVRPDIYKQLQKRDAGNQSYILITTSAIEVGCDLNSDVLISQICPPENLVQRAGRCNRKGNVPDAKIILVGDDIPDFANTLDEAALQKYQNTLRDLASFETAKISECISVTQQVDDYRVVELFSMLHEYVYQANRTCQHLHKRGLIPTRSWTPSVKLEFISQETHSISVPIDRLYTGEQYANIHAYEKWYDKENTRWDTEHLLRWGSAYGKEITIRIHPEKKGVVYDVSLQSYSYDEELGFVELPRIFIKKWVDGADEKLLHVEGKHKAIVSYTKSLSKERVDY